MYQPIKRAHTA
jgi:hypothetical protein